VIFGQALAAGSSSESASISVPLLVVAAAVGVAWVLLLAALVAWRRPHRIESRPASQDLPPITPAVAGLACDDFELSAELPPATLLDLAARPRRPSRGSRAGQDDLPCPPDPIR